MKTCITHHYGCDCREEFIREAFEYILNEAYLFSEDSLVDIANEAFKNLNFEAYWTNDNDMPIIIKEV